MTDVTIDAEVFNPIYIPYLNCETRTQIFFGGSSSGKSVFWAQRCVVDVMKGGRNYLVTRQVARTLRASAFAQVNRIIAEWGLAELFNVNKSEMLITCANGYQIAFVGLDDTEKIKSIVPAKGAWTDIIVEEATETSRDTIKNLMKRQRGGDESIPKRLTMSFNPILQSHWIYQDYFSALGWADQQVEYASEALSILKTTYKDNRFLTSGDIYDLENETDPYYYNVYSLGNWGVLGAVIFTNWRVEDLIGMQDQFTNRRNGLDFGFSSDPAAIIRSHYDKKHKKIYIFDELYERGLTNDILARRALELCEQDAIICDSAEPKSIEELKRYGINARAAKKGKDSVLHGIQWMQQQTVIIDKKCINAINEFQQYKWKEDKDGNAIRQPVDKNNHLIDACRYAYEGDSNERVVKFIENPLHQEYIGAEDGLWVY